MNDMSPPPAREIALDAQEWNIVLAGLGELPLKISRNLFEKIVQRLQEAPGANFRSHGG